MARGVDGRAIFCDDHDYDRFTRDLLGIARSSEAAVLAHCLMPNHFHVAVKVGVRPLSDLMQRILTSYSISFNRRHDRTGHLFQARYKALLCLDDTYLTVLIRYIHNNPVRAGLVGSAAEWRWSSYRRYANAGKNGLIETLDDFPDIAHFDPWPKTDSRPLLLRSNGDEPRRLDEIGKEAAGDIPISALRSAGRQRYLTALRRRFVVSAHAEGHSLRPSPIGSASASMP